MVGDGTSTARRVIAGHKRPGEPLRLFDQAGEVSPARRPRTDPSDSTHHGGNMSTREYGTAPITRAVPTVVATARFEGYGPDDEVLVRCQGPVAVAADAARKWAEVMDPYLGSADKLDMKSVSWLDWLSKLLPFLRQR